MFKVQNVKCSELDVWSHVGLSDTLLWTKIWIDQPVKVDILEVTR